MSAEVMKRITRDKIVQIFENEPKRSFTVEEIHKVLEDSGSIDKNQVLSHFRQIISAGKIRVIYGRETDPLQYVLIDPKIQDQFVGLDEEAHKIYDMIERAGNKGIWRRDLKKFVGSIDEKRINAVLKELETRCLVKIMTSIHEKKLKLYLLYDMIPSEEITGGVWYMDGTFNTNFVEQLIAQSIAVVHNSRVISIKDMVEKIKATTLIPAHVSDREAAQVINAMVHSKRVVRNGGVLKPGIITLPICPTFEIPCCGCPIADSCFPGSPKRPRECPYLNKLTEVF